MKRDRRTTAERTYQERGLGISTPERLRPPACLWASDLGTFGVSLGARDALPAGARFYQVVDAHLGDAASEVWAIREGFGYARSWHYEALGLSRAVRDGEGRSVTRFLRLLRFEGQGRGRTLVPWRG